MSRNSTGAASAASASSKSGTNYDAVFSDKKDNSIMDPSAFLNLMVTQMQNQDFTDPMDNTDMITQMAQFSNMEMMQQMASYSKTNYAVSLVGKSVTASKISVSGQLDTTVGVVDQVSLVDNDYVISIGSKKYSLEHIMGIGETKDVSIDTDGCELVATDITDKKATITWDVPTDDKDIAGKLKYTVYYGTSNDFNTVEKVENGTMVGLGDDVNITTMDIKNLLPDTTYYANVVVTNVDGTKEVYKQVEIITAK